MSGKSVDGLEQIGNWPGTFVIDHKFENPMPIGSTERRGILSGFIGNRWEICSNMRIEHGKLKLNIFAASAWHPCIHVFVPFGYGCRVHLTCRIKKENLRMDDFFCSPLRHSWCKFLASQSRSVDDVQWTRLAGHSSLEKPMQLSPEKIFHFQTLVRCDI